MATTVKAFVITLAIYAAILIVCLLLFSKWRRLKLTRKLYSPKLYMEDREHKPPKLSKSFFGWVPEVWSFDEDQIVRSAGVDAAIYIKYLRLCCELFLFISLISMIIALPINVTGGEVDKLIAANGYATETSNYTWWVPPAPEAGNETESDAAVGTINPPEMYNDSIPDPPPGLIWWQYLPGVPPLASPEETLGPSYSNYGWRYDQNYLIISYTFTELDKTTLANIENGSPRLYAYVVLTYVVSAFTMWQLWRYCKEALRLRMYYLLRTPKGAQSHTVLCTDIPGIAYGTIPNRLDGTLLKFVPDSVKQTAFAQVNRLQTKAKSQLSTATTEDIEANNIGREISGTSKLDTTTGLSKRGTTTQSESFAAALQQLATASNTKDLEALLSLKTFKMPDRWGEVCDELDTGSSIQHVVESAFTSIHENHFNHAHVVYDTGKLDKMVEIYEATKDKLIDTIEGVFVMKENAVTKGKSAIKREQTMVIPAKMDSWAKQKYGLKPKNVDALTFRRELLEHQYEEILKEQQRCRAPGSTIYPAAFVTFDSRKSQVVAAYSMMSEDLTTWKCQPAPAPEEVVWSNLGLRSWERSSRRAIMWVAFIVMMMFFMIPVTAIQGLITLDSLDIDWIQNIPFINALFSSIIPSLVLNWLLGFIPAILAWMTKWSGANSQTEIDHGVITTFFLFQIITVYLTSFIAGSFATQLKQFLEEPSQIYSLMGSSAPQVGLFFTNFVLFRAGFDMPISELVRPVGLIKYRIKNRLTKTQAAKQRLWAEQDVSYGELIPTDNLSALVGLAFCLVSPLIAPVTLIYYLVCYLINKYNLMYCYEVSYESGGQAWKKIFNQLTGCMLLYQVTMMAILAIKGSIGGPFILLPLPLITLAYLVSAHKTFWQPMMTLSMLSAAVLDQFENEDGGGAQHTADEVNEEVKARYLSPSFKVDAEEHERLVRQTIAVENALDSGNLDDLKEVDEFGNELTIQQTMTSEIDDPFYTPTDSPRAGDEEERVTPFSSAAAMPDGANLV